MYLKSLTLKGFKSFADRAHMTFEPGLTVIVGPNGSGKSNISDAILWVLGEQSAKQLRGQAMEDVIFSGSSARQPVGVAEVTLVLDNADHVLPVDFDEVAITRRMYRSGESEYLINQSPCRLMDIQDILHDSGLGKDTHSIISQGKLDAILQSRPEERRTLVEEAAGISKHKRRKERAAVAFRRLLNYQQEAAAAYAKRIDETADALAKNRGNAGAVNALASAPSVSAELARHYGNFDSYIAAKAKFTNPFAHYLTGIFLMHNFQSLSDKENAIVSLRLADAGTGALSEEIAAAQDSAHGKNAEFRTYVIYECGMACRRDQFKVDLPLWVFNRNLPGISASFPYLYKVSCNAKLEVSLDGRRIALNKIADMDDIITEEFNANLPTLIYRTLLSVVVKASAQYAGARAAGDYGVFVNLAGSLYQGIVNNADLRTWTTLPKTISVASFKTPSSMIVKINSAIVKLKGKNNIIYITLPATGAPATVRTFPL